MKLVFSIKSIYIREGRLWMADDFNPLIPGQELVGEYRVGANHKRMITQLQHSEGAKSWYAFTTRYEFRYTSNSQDSDAERKPVAEIIANISADYELNESEQVSDDELAKWGRENVVLQTWPYWREFCHAALSRMNLPQTLMPLLVASQKQETADSDSPIKSTEAKADRKRPSKKVQKS